MTSIIQKTAFLIGLGFAAFLTSCANPDEAEPRHSIVGDWKSVSLVVEEDHEPARDIFPDLDPCEQDNIKTFSSDMQYIDHEGITGCGMPGGTILDQGKYVISGDQLTTTSHLDPSETYTYTISVTETMMKMRIETSWFGDVTAVTLTLQRL